MKYLLATALAIVNLHYGYAVVTMSPSLAKIVPTNLPPLREEYINCFNKYWDIKEDLETQLYQQWNCTVFCSKGQQCCISYKVWDTLSTVNLVDHCSTGALDMIRMFLPMALKQIQEKCEPDYEHGSDQCRGIEANLKPTPVSAPYDATCPRKVCVCY